MAEEAGEDVHTLTTPSFEGRLKLSQFMYASSETVSTSAVRRSARLGGLSSATSSPTQSPVKGAAALSSPARSGKRRHEPEDASVVPTKTSRATTKSSAPSSAAAGSRTPSPKKRARTSSGYAPPSTYAHLSQLPDVVAPNLLILFVGLNPGLQTARSGHAYAHPSNLFWKLLYSSGITPERCRAEEDRTLPARFALGNTNIVARPSRNGAELSRAEMDAGVAALEAKARRWRPEVVCLVGKGIWESVWRVRRGRAITKAEFRYGWQDRSEDMGVGPGMGDEEGGGVKEEEDDGVKLEEEEEPFQGARIFVATSTSGLAATLRPEEKERIWKELGDWCKTRREERKAEEALKVEATSP